MMCIIPVSFDQQGPETSLSDLLTAPTAWSGPRVDLGRCDPTEGGCGFPACRLSKTEHTKAPNTLAVHLKRALSDTVKNVRPVRFDLELRIMGRRYRLCSVVVHSGRASGGHYTCFAFKNENWWFFDDEKRPKVVQDSEVLRAEATLLFYVDDEAWM